MIRYFYSRNGGGADKSALAYAVRANRLRLKKGGAIAPRERGMTPPMAECCLIRYTAAASGKAIAITSRAICSSSFVGITRMVVGE